MHKWFFVLFLFCSALQADIVEDLSLGLGNWTKYVGRVQKDAKANHRAIDFLPYFSVSAQKQLLFLDEEGHFLFLPELGITFPYHGRDKWVDKLSFFAFAGLGYQYQDFVFFVAPGMAYTMIQLDGGTATLNNGVTTTAFPLVRGTSTASNFVVNLGVEYRLNPIEVLNKFSFKTQVSLYNLTDSDSRTWAYFLSLHYHFGAL